jgi:hypothetical protein
MRRLIIPLALAAMLLVPAGAHARTVFLDTHDRGRDRYIGPVATETLVRGAPYVATVRGTFSYYGRGEYRKRFCGRPERAPIYRSRGVRNGRVNADAEFIFAEQIANCGRRGNTAVENSFQVRTGRAYRELARLGAPITAPRADHTYQYALVGEGIRARFRLPDRIAGDNYGRLRISLRRATAADCAGGNFAIFGYTDEATCVAGTAIPAAR